MGDRRRGTLFYNKTSGSKDEAQIDELRAYATEIGLTTEVADEGMGRIVADRIREGERLFIAAGGDGTIHHLAQHLVRTETALGIVPMGTFNHLARDLKIPLDWRAALDIALDGEVMQIDAGLVNGRYFLNNVILGLYPELVRRREKLRRWYGKWRAYFNAFRYAMKRFPHISLVVETATNIEAIKTHVFAVSVNRYDLGSVGIIAPKMSFDDGRLSVYWLPYLRKFQFILMLAHYLSGRVRPGDQFRFLSTQKLKVQSSRSQIRLGVDGELVELTSPLDISIVPQGLLVKVPKGTEPEVRGTGRG